MTKTRRSISWFTLIGAMAAADHYVIALLAKNLLVLSPAWANFFGFCCAFPVSYFGHRHLSFPDQSRTHQQALPRFLTIAILGFCANQVLFLLILKLTPIPFWLALALVMIIVAVSTYLLSRHWAFSSI
jgi:putative flippase GtrA